MTTMQRQKRNILAHATKCAKIYQIQTDGVINCVSFGDGCLMWVIGNHKRLCSWATKHNLWRSETLIISKNGSVSWE
jgi:hypothetical protein